MRSLKILLVVLLGLGLVVATGDGTLVAAADSHATHFVSDKGPLLPQDETGCVTCHAPGHLQCGEDAPLFGDAQNPLPLDDTDVCDNCHSPGGAFDGVNDPVIGAKANWESGVYDGDNLVAGKEQWCATCHDDEPAYSNQNGEVLVGSTLVDNNDPECTFHPDWNHVGGRNAYGGTFLWINPGDGSKTVTWTPNIPISGRYNISMWNPYSGSRGNVTYTVNHASGSTDVPFDQTVAQKRWLFLGNFEFDAGTSGSVVLGDLGDGTYINADAMEFVLVAGGARAPSVIGDNDTFGFYVTGHKISCLECHVASRPHIDHEPRTYEVSDDYTACQAVVTPYVVGYRLADGAMNIPNPNWVSGEPTLEIEDYALCFSCHNPEEVWGTVYWDVSHTNFWDTKNDKGNQHNYHLRIKPTRADTDWDGVRDSREGCTACHNVHGSPAGPMIRQGQLISTPGTTDKVPALDFIYLGAPPPGDPATATFTATSLVGGGDYNVYAWWVDQHPVWRATDATYTVHYTGGADEVVVDQTWNGPGGGQWNLLGTYHYDPGATGTVVLDNDFASVGFWVIADAVRWEKVGGGDEVIVDNPAATFDPDHNEWRTAEGVDQTYGADFRYIRSHSTPPADASATWENSYGGWMRHRGSTIAASYVCITCHSDDYVARYERTPKFWPKVLTFPGASADIVPNDGTGQSVITVHVVDPDDNLSTVTIDLSPVGGSDVQPMTEIQDGTWQYTWNVAQGTTVDTYELEITATDSEANTGTGKVPITVFEPGAIYVDDTDAVVVPDCVEPCDPLTEWTPYTNAQQYATGFRYKVNDPSGSGTITWTPDLPVAGQYDVYAWWVAQSGYWRSENVPYTVYYDGGSERVEVDQTTSGPGGGQWNYLGTWTFAAGTAGYVVLSDDATDAPLPGGTTWVVGDAIKLVPAP